MRMCGRDTIRPASDAWVFFALRRHNWHTHRSCVMKAAGKIRGSRKYEPAQIRSQNASKEGESEWIGFIGGREFAGLSTAPGTGGSFCFFFSIVVSFSSGHITMTALPCRRSRARYRRPCTGRHPALGTSLPERLTAGACHRDLTKQIPSVRTQPAAPGSAVFPPTR